MAYSSALDVDLKYAADALKLQNPAWLKNLIQAESGWNPTAFNATAGATGLIQFIPRTMKALGILSGTLAAQIPATGAVTPALKESCRREFLAKYPTAAIQLRGPVVSYLRQYMPFHDEQSLYLAVFYPAYRSKDADTAFPASVAAANPGIDTVADYVNFVKKAGAKLGPGGGMAALIGAGIAAYLMLRA